jgi:Protein of unknown function (DUF2442)
VRKGNAIRVASVNYQGGYSLRIRWVNGKAMSVDLQKLVSRFAGMRPLRHKSVFARAGKGEGGHSVVWPGQIDLGADRLWEMTLHQNGRRKGRELQGFRAHRQTPPNPTRSLKSARSRTRTGTAFRAEGFSYSLQLSLLSR